MKERLIYVLEDVFLLQDMLKRILEREGYVVRCFFTPSELLLSLVEKQERPGLILTDYGLPEITGDEVIRQVKKLGKPFYDIPFIGLSDSHPEAREAFAKEGVPFLVKTLFDAAILIDTVNKTFR